MLKLLLLFPGGDEWGTTHCMGQNVPPALFKPWADYHDILFYPVPFQSILWYMEMPPNQSPNQQFGVLQTQQRGRSGNTCQCGPTGMTLAWPWLYGANLGHTWPAGHSWTTLVLIKVPQFYIWGADYWIHTNGFWQNIQEFFLKHTSNMLTSVWVSHSLTGMTKKEFLLPVCICITSSV